MSNKNVKQLPYEKRKGEAVSDEPLSYTTD